MVYLMIIRLHLEFSRAGLPGRRNHSGIVKPWPGRSRYR